MVVRFTFIALSFLSFHSLLVQQLSGRIIDADGQPVITTTARVENTNHAVATDKNSKFKWRKESHKAKSKYILQTKAR